MFTVIITEKGGAQKRMEFDKPEVTIGRVQGNDIILPKGNVSKRHSRIVLKDGRFIIVDLKSTNGTYVNGRKITSPLVIKSGDKVYIGDFILGLEEGPVSVSPDAAAARAPARAPAAAGGPPPMPARPMPGAPAAAPAPAPAQRQPPSPQVPSPQQPQQPARPFPMTPGPAQQTPSAGLPGNPAMPSIPQPMGSPAGPSPTGNFGPSVRPPASAQPAGGPAPRPQAGTPPRAEPPPARPEALLSPAPLSPQATVESVSPPSMPSSQAIQFERLRSPLAPRRGDRQVEAYQQLLSSIHHQLIQQMDLRRLDVSRLGDEELRQRTMGTIRSIVSQFDGDGHIPDFVQRDKLVEDVLNEALGLGPLEALLADDQVNEVMVNHSQQIYVERNGSLELVDMTFSSEAAVLSVIERIVAPVGRRIDESSPMVDARLHDGSRVNAIIPPLAIRGPCLTIRKFRRDMLGPEDLVRMGTFSRPIAEFLEMCVKARRNIVISGGTGSGKTTTLNILASFIPTTERIVTIEDAAELQLPQDHVVALETKPPNIEGKGEVTIRDLVRNALRMRPDRIVVGECRGGEALDMLQAMNTGHDGSLTTLHANNTRDALSRLETMVLMSGMELPVRAIREQIAAAIDIVVQQTRFAGGKRIITQIAEVTGMEGDVITTQDIFSFQQEGLNGEGQVQGRFTASGLVPKFYNELSARGLEVNMRIFSPEGAV